MAEMKPCDACTDGKLYKNVDLHKRQAHKDPVTPTATAGDTKVARTAKPSQSTALMNALSDLTSFVKKVDERLTRIETGGKDDFKLAAKPEDVSAADESKRHLDPRIVDIVENTLGGDFRIEVTSHKDKPGFLFTILVPTRLSDVQKQLRPVKGEDGRYKLDSQGNTEFEEYQPEDRRSREIASTDSYDAIKEHAERIRAHIVAFYQKTNRPLPEFRIKQSA